MGILGETQRSSGVINISRALIDEGFAFVSQTCWLQRATVRDNILFGEPYNHDFYNQVISATALQVDLQVRFYHLIRFIFYFFDRICQVVICMRLPIKV